MPYLRSSNFSNCFCLPKYFGFILYVSLEIETQGILLNLKSLFLFPPEGLKITHLVKWTRFFIKSAEHGILNW